MRVASRLSPEEFHILAEEPLFTIFRSLQFEKDPFTEAVKDRLIAGQMDGFQLEERKPRGLGQ